METLTEKFDVRKLVGQEAYWDGRGLVLIRRDKKHGGEHMDALDRLVLWFADHGTPPLLEGIVVNTHEGDALTVHLAAMNVYVHPGGYALVY